MMTRVSVHHQPDFKRDFVSFGVSNRSLGNLGRGEPEFIKTSADLLRPISYPNFSRHKHPESTKHKLVIIMIKC